MPFIEGSHWIMIVLGGAIAVIVSSFTATGCRVGNYTEKAPNPDAYTGYYVTTPQSLLFYANVSTSRDTFKKTASLNYIPNEITQVMTNPVILYMHDLGTGQASIVAPQSKYSLPVFVVPDHVLSFSGSSTAATFWGDPACQSYFDLSEEGLVTSNPNVKGPPDLKVSLSGSVQLKIQLVYHFRGNCTPTLQTIAACYQDANQCNGKSSAENLQLQQKAIALFDPYIQSQTISLADLPNLTNYAYEVSYE